MASFTAAGTAYATWGEPMAPFFIFYSMFGFHRFADLLWAAGDMRARGFLLAATAGRTTLQGEGLQHCDGHSLLFASAIPNLRAYDPAFAYEVAVIVRDGIERMYGADAEDLLYYLTLYNEGFPQPAMPAGVEAGILAGLYRYRDHRDNRTHRARVVASGTAMLAALEAQQLLSEHHDVAADVWSATSYKALRDDAMAVERLNRLHPSDSPRVPYVQRVLENGDGPVIAVTDFVKLVPDQVARWMPRPFVSLGTDGFGLSDTRSALRRHFETDAAHIVVATLWGLFLQGDVKADTVIAAARHYDIDPDLQDPHDS
jgi:pyruvate dehydrogenase E1 component